MTEQQDASSVSVETEETEDETPVTIDVHPIGHGDVTFVDEPVED